MNKILRYLEAKRGPNEDYGFSLIDVVITVAIVVALSVGGFIAYNGVVDNARQASVDAAASQVYKASLVYEADGDMGTTACTAIDEYNDTTKEIDVSIIVEDAGTYYVYPDSAAGPDVDEEGLPIMLVASNGSICS